MDLRELCSQIENIVNMKDCEEMVRRMMPVAKRLERLSEEIMSTGDTILNRLQFIPRTLSQGDIPGNNGQLQNHKPYFYSNPTLTF